MLGTVLPEDSICSSVLRLGLCFCMAGLARLVFKTFFLKKQKQKTQNKLQTASTVFLIAKMLASFEQEK